MKLTPRKIRPFSDATMQLLKLHKITHEQIVIAYRDALHDFETAYMPPGLCSFIRNVYWSPTACSISLRETCEKVAQDEIMRRLKLTVNGDLSAWAGDQDVAYRRKASTKYTPYAYSRDSDRGHTFRRKLIEMMIAYHASFPPNKLVYKTEKELKSQGRLSWKPFERKQDTR